MPVVVFQQRLFHNLIPPYLRGRCVLSLKSQICTVQIQIVLPRPARVTIKIIRLITAGLLVARLETRTRESTTHACIKGILKEAIVYKHCQDHRLPRSLTLGKSGLLCEKGKMIQYYRSAKTNSCRKPELIAG